MAISEDVLKKNLDNKVILEKLMSVLGLSIIALYTYLIAYKQCLIPSDYYVHMGWARDLSIVGIKERPYFIWHGITKILYIIFREKISIQIVAALTTSFFNCCCYTIVNWYFKRECGICHGLIALVLMVVEPIFAPIYTSGIYTGHCGSPNAWHNPTHLTVRPFAIVTFILAVDLIDTIKNHEKVGAKEIARFSLILFLSVLAKPSFFQGFFPAFCIYLIILFMKNQCKDFKTYFMIAAVCIPAVMMVLYQFLYSFFGDGTLGDGGIGFEWGRVAHFYTRSMPIALILVLLFPILYILFNLKELINKTDFQLCCAFFCMSYFEFGMLYEKGDRMYDGNFAWALELSYFVIWMLCFKYMYNKHFEQKRNIYWITAILYTVLLVHVYSGVAYINQLVLIPGRIY